MQKLSPISPELIYYIPGKMSERLKLLDLPGIGSRIRERLMEHYGDEEKALHAVSSGDVASLTKMP